MKLLCVNSGEHSCTTAYMVDGKIMYSLEEERFCRVKSSTDFTNETFRYPINSLMHLYNKFGVAPRDVDYLIMTCPYKGLDAFLNWFGAMSGQNKDNPLNISDFPIDKILNIDHHFAHCNLAYYTSGFNEDEQVFVVSIDAAGGDYSAKYYIGYQNQLTFIDGIDSTRKSFGHFYAALTELLGFRRLKDEGKVVGLAGQSTTIDNKLYDVWSKILELEPNRIITKPDNHSKKLDYGGVYEEVYSAFMSVVGSNFWKSSNFLKVVANTGQQIFEHGILNVLNRLHERYPNVKRLALSGGCFANVKLNMKINELDWVDEVYITPPMGDEGLSWGSCIAAQQQIVGDVKVRKLNNSFLGVGYSREEIESVANEYNATKVSHGADIIEVASTMLVDEQICAIYQGRSEHGPRALGNRSILADPRGGVTYEKLNGILKRNDFMPFAPVVLDKYANDVFDVKKSRYTAEFMTMCYNTREEWIDKIPLVVHPVDKTARIQIVTETSNPMLYKLLLSFYDKTNIPLLLNTSFNVHNEPIVNSPVDAFKHLEKNTIDYLITEHDIYCIK